MASARSFGMFPRKAGWVDAQNILTHGVAKEVVNLQHSGEVTFLAYFSADAVGSVKVTTSNGYEVVLEAAGERDLKVMAVRSGYEIGDMTAGGTQASELTLDTSLLTAGTAQVSVF